MNKLLLCLLVITNFYITQAQKVSDYTIAVHFFPEDAQMWGYPVANKSFMKGQAKVEFSALDDEVLTFYLHGELKIDSITSNHTTLEYNSEKIFYDIDYSNVGLKTTITSHAAITDHTLTVYYSGFMNPSRARSLSDYMRINKAEGVFLRGFYYSLWFPVFQKSDTADDDYEVNFKQIQVKLPKAYHAAVTGKLLGETIEDDIYTAIWQPGKIKLSDIQCTAKPFEILSRDNIFVYYTDDRQSGENIIDFTQKLKQLFYSNFRNVQNAAALYIIEMPEYGNISSQNVIGISSDLYKGFNTDLFSQLTIAHELVHPYVTIPIAKDNPFSALVVEGFPSYFHLYGLTKISNHTKDFDLKRYMQRVEKSYLAKKETGKDRRGNKLPPEKPILEITFDEIGLYKDVFILSDRANLFLYHLWREMGEAQYDQFLKALFQFDSIDYDKFAGLVIQYLPNYGDNLHLWLNTTDYPDSLRVK